MPIFTVYMLAIIGTWTPTNALLIDKAYAGVIEILRRVREKKLSF